MRDSTADQKLNASQAETLAQANVFLFEAQRQLSVVLSQQTDDGLLRAQLKIAIENGTFFDDVRRANKESTISAKENARLAYLPIDEQGNINLNPLVNVSVNIENFLRLNHLASDFELLDLEYGSAALTMKKNNMMGNASLYMLITKLRKAVSDEIEKDESKASNPVSKRFLEIKQLISEMSLLLNAVGSFEKSLQRGNVLSITKEISENIDQMIVKLKESIFFNNYAEPIQAVCNTLEAAKLALSAVSQSNAGLAASHYGIISLGKKSGNVGTVKKINAFLTFVANQSPEQPLYTASSDTSSPLEKIVERLQQSVPKDKSQKKTAYAQLAVSAIKAYIDYEKSMRNVPETDVLREKNQIALINYLHRLEKSYSTSFFGNNPINGFLRNFRSSELEKAGLLTLLETKGKVTEQSYFVGSLAIAIKNNEQNVIAERNDAIEKSWFTRVFYKKSAISPSVSFTDNEIFETRAREEIAQIYANQEISSPDSLLKSKPELLGMLQALQAIHSSNASPDSNQRNYGQFLAQFNEKKTALRLQLSDPQDLYLFDGFCVGRIQLFEQSLLSQYHAFESGRGLVANDNVDIKTENTKIVRQIVLDDFLNRLFSGRISLNPIAFKNAIHSMIEKENQMFPTSQSIVGESFNFLECFDFINQGIKGVNSNKNYRESFNSMKKLPSAIKTLYSDASGVSQLSPQQQAILDRFYTYAQSYHQQKGPSPFDQLKVEIQAGGTGIFKSLSRTKVFKKLEEGKPQAALKTLEKYREFIEKTIQKFSTKFPGDRADDAFSTALKEIKEAYLLEAAQCYVEKQLVQPFLDTLEKQTFTVNEIIENTKWVSLKEQIERILPGNAPYVASIERTVNSTMAPLLREKYINEIEKLAGNDIEISKEIYRKKELVIQEYMRLQGGDSTGFHEASITKIFGQAIANAIASNPDSNASAQLMHALGLSSALTVIEHKITLPFIETIKKQETLKDLLNVLELDGNVSNRLKRDSEEINSKLEPFLESLSIEEDKTKAENLHLNYKSDMIREVLSRIDEIIQNYTKIMQRESATLQDIHDAVANIKDLSELADQLINHQAPDIRSSNQTYLERFETKTRVDLVRIIEKRKQTGKFDSELKTLGTSSAVNLLSQFAEKSISPEEVIVDMNIKNRDSEESIEYALKRGFLVPANFSSENLDDNVLEQFFNDNGISHLAFYEHKSFLYSLLRDLPAKTIELLEKANESSYKVSMVQVKNGTFSWNKETKQYETKQIYAIQILSEEELTSSDEEGSSNNKSKAMRADFYIELNGTSKVNDMGDPEGLEVAVTLTRLGAVRSAEKEKTIALFLQGFEENVRTFNQPTQHGSSDQGNHSSSQEDGDGSVVMINQSTFNRALNPKEIFQQFLAKVNAIYANFRTRLIEGDYSKEAVIQQLDELAKTFQNDAAHTPQFVESVLAEIASVKKYCSVLAESHSGSPSATLTLQQKQILIEAIALYNQVNGTTLSAEDILQDNNNNPRDYFFRHIAFNPNLYSQKIILLKLADLDANLDLTKSKKPSLVSYVKSSIQKDYTRYSLKDDQSLRDWGDLYLLDGVLNQASAHSKNTAFNLALTEFFDKNGIDDSLHKEYKKFFLDHVHQASLGGDVNDFLQYEQPRNKRKYNVIPPAKEKVIIRYDQQQKCFYFTAKNSIQIMPTDAHGMPDVDIEPTWVTLLTDFTSVRDSSGRLTLSQTKTTIHCDDSLDLPHLKLFQEDLLRLGYTKISQQADLFSPNLMHESKVTQAFSEMTQNFLDSKDRNINLSQVSDRIDEIYKDYAKDLNEQKYQYFSQAKVFLTNVNKIQGSYINYLNKDINLEKFIEEVQSISANAQPYRKKELKAFSQEMQETATACNLAQAKIEAIKGDLHAKNTKQYKTVDSKVLNENIDNGFSQALRGEQGKPYYIYIENLIEVAKEELKKQVTDLLALPRSRAASTTSGRLSSNLNALIPSTSSDNITRGQNDMPGIKTGGSG